MHIWREGKYKDKPEVVSGKLYSYVEDDLLESAKYLDNIGLTDVYGESIVNGSAYWIGRLGPFRLTNVEYTAFKNLHVAYDSLAELYKMYVRDNDANKTLVLEAMNHIDDSLTIVNTMYEELAAEAEKMLNEN